MSDYRGMLCDHHLVMKCDSVMRRDHVMVYGHCHVMVRDCVEVCGYRPVMPCDPVMMLDPVLVCDYCHVILRDASTCVVAKCDPVSFLELLHSKVSS